MAGLIVGFGPQNCFVIQAAISAPNRWIVPTVSLAGDALLTSLGAFGFASLLPQATALTRMPSFLAAGLLFIYGLKKLFGTIAVVNPTVTQAVPSSNFRLATTALALSLFNPWVYFDTILVLGAASSRLDVHTRPCFVSGALLVSAVWFYGLTFGAHKLLRRYPKAKTSRLIDGAVALSCFAAATQILLSKIGDNRQEPRPPYAP